MDTPAAPSLPQSLPGKEPTMTFLNAEPGTRNVGHLDRKFTVPISKFRVAFTLAELLIVIAIIVILIGILLPALGMAKKKAKDIATRTQLESIAKANEQYNLSFGSYAGFMGEEYLADATKGKNKLTSTQNMLISMMGRVVQASSAPPNSWGIPNTNFYVLRNEIGSGPASVAGQVYGAFYPAKAEEMATISGDTDGDPTSNRIPEFVDASYGLPILSFRARGGWVRPASTLAGETATNKGAFLIDPVEDYTGNVSNFASPANATTTGGQPYSQEFSLLRNSTDGVNTLAWITINTKLSDLSSNDPNSVPRNDVPLGAFVLTASGNDRVYFSREQVGDATTGKIDNVDELKNFDDIITHGGTAP